MVFDKRSRDHRTHGIVENSMADPMRALPGPCGASLGSEGPPKGQKYAFGTRNHLFREISRNYENPKFENFWSRTRSTIVLDFQNRSGVNRTTGGCGSEESGLERPRKAHLCNIKSPRYRLLAIAIFRLYALRMCTAQCVELVTERRRTLRVFGAP